MDNIISSGGKGRGSALDLRSQSRITNCNCMELQEFYPAGNETDDDKWEGRVIVLNFFDLEEKWFRSRESTQRPFYFFHILFRGIAGYCPETSVAAPPRPMRRCGCWQRTHCVLPPRQK